MESIVECDKSYNIVLKYDTQIPKHFLRQNAHSQPISSRVPQHLVSQQRESDLSCMETMV